jgi:hypothetical protein
MSKLIHTFTLPGGFSDTRESERAYTHVVVWVQTKEERDRRINKHLDEIADLEGKIAGLRAAAESEADKVAYKMAQGRLAYLQDDITEESTRSDGSKYTSTHPRWISDAIFPGRNGRQALDHAYAAADATAQGKIDKLSERLKFAHTKLIGANERHIGRSSVYRWSMSRRGAEIGVREVLKHAPLDNVYISTDIKVRERVSRPKK